MIFKISKSDFFSIIERVFAAFFAMLSSIIVTRELNSIDFVSYQLLMSGASVMMAFTYFIPASIAYKIFINGNTELISKITRDRFSISICVTTVIFPVVNYFVFGGALPFWVIAFSLAWIIFQEPLATLRQFLEANGFYTYASIIRLAAPFAKILGLVICLALKIKISLFVVAFILTWEVFLSGIVQLFIIKNKKIKYKGWREKTNVSELIKYSPYVFVAASQQIFIRADRLIISRGGGGDDFAHAYLFFSMLSDHLFMAVSLILNTSIISAIKADVGRKGIYRIILTRAKEKLLIIAVMMTGIISASVLLAIKMVAIKTSFFDIVLYAISCNVNSMLCAFICTWLAVLISYGNVKLVFVLYVVFAAIVSLPHIMASYYKNFLLSALSPFIATAIIFCLKLNEARDEK